MKFLNILLLCTINSIVHAFAEDTSVTEDEINDYEIEHQSVLDQHLSECTVLLRKNGDFPISSSERKIHLYGGGIRHTVKGGLGSGNIKTRTFDTIETAFKKEGFEVLSSEYLDAYDDCYEKAHDDFIQGLRDGFDYANPYGYLIDHFSVIMDEPECDIPIDESGDLAVYVVSRITGEGIDRKVAKGDIFLTDSEKKAIKTLARGYKKFMLVLNTGGPVDLSGLEEVQNILVLSQLGFNTSKTLVDLVTGEKYPSGKLTTTWTKYDDYFANTGNLTDVDYVEGVYVGYRYFDSADVDVLFPFGHGLSYTEFENSIKSVKINGEKVTVDAIVTNVGKAKGKEVLELYLSKPSTSDLDEPYQELVNFAKTKELSPKKKDNVKLEFKLSDFASYDSKSQAYVLNAGNYIIRIGNSSRNTVPCAVIEVPSKVIVKKVQNQLADSGFQDLVFKSKKEDDLTGVPVLTLNAKHIKTETVDYTKKSIINEEVKGLSVEEKVSLVIGAHSSDPYGSYVYSVAGVAGEFYKFRDLKPAVLSDGPAGINIAKDYYIGEDGLPHSTEGMFGSDTLDIVPLEMRDAFSFLFPFVPEGVTYIHQYTTAIPIGTALAQSWNVNFAKKCGDIVGDEMNIFGINFWLAPALNIHRTIVNGRNFEYYSEDPYISGMMAASITKGVQGHEKAYVTLKHFLGNNKETNRSFNSSNMSERAFREVYLRGFEIAIKNGKPGGIMSSYNLVNGIHVNEHVGIMTNVLRKELEYNEVVMTDWLFANMANTDTEGKYPQYSAVNIIKASGDVVMQGNKDFFDEVVAAIEDNTLSMEELEASATRIYEVILKVQN
ncbi:beta-glucosidase-related glycosidase [Piromyces finnis]|uniref:beta-glucosidase n=1 Tax=Piromyces finnis TaxID=1754191 RepID=A0A1Y1VBK5_9FUNG|nr:beta-glucosidase-related glycosidase [Piromyces finnis]|eukprot:ORX52069.1 beta-glucosidase-related glycosidase [Piromyces finnis]